MYLTTYIKMQERVHRNINSLLLNSGRLTKLCKYLLISYLNDRYIEFSIFLSFSTSPMFIIFYSATLNAPEHILI